MKSWLWKLVPVLAVLLALPASARTEQVFGGGEILWDSFGVPHIYAKTEAGGFYGFGWAQAQSHGNILLKMYGESRARGAEYWGADAEPLDRWLIANDVPERSRAWFRAQTPAMRRNLDAFADGINAYAAAHLDALAPEVRQVLPITGVDIVGHAHRLMNYYYLASEGRVLAAAGPAGEGEAVLPPEGSDGSNAWAVMPGRTAAGKTLLLANPHLPWAPSMLSYYEAQISAPGYNVYGATQVGLPVVRFAYNDNLGFTNTVNTILGYTRYALTLEGDGYRFDGKVLPFTRVQKSYKVRQGDGSLKKCQFTFTCDGALRRQLDNRVLVGTRVMASRLLAGDFTPSVGGATHYHANYVAPYWASSLFRVGQIGAHIFYRAPGSLDMPARYPGGAEPQIAALGQWLGAIDPLTQGESYSRRSPPALLPELPTPPPAFSPWGIPVR